jgi:hypothetical protein
MLNNEPRCFRAVRADCLLVRPATFVDHLSQPLCIPDVHCLHAWNIAAPKLAGINQFLTNSQVFDAHCNQFFSKGIIQQGSDRIYAPWGEDPFVALQYAIDYIGQLLDAAVDRQQLQDRKKRSCGDNNGWIWRYPRLSTGKRLDSL